MWWFSEAEIESWLQACPWGLNRYINDNTNHSSCRASQWQARPDYALLDLYNVLYKPQLNFEHSNLTRTCVITFYAPLVAPVNGVTVDFQWRKHKRYYSGEENTFISIPLKQLEQLNGAKWELFPNRTGWKLSFTYDALRNMLTLFEYDTIEMCVKAQVHPTGKGSPVLSAFDTEYTLLSRYYEADKGNNNNRRTRRTKTMRHKADYAQTLRRISLTPRNYHLNIDKLPF